MIRVRSDYDVSRAPASIRREQKMNMSIFRRSRVVVVSQSNRTQIIISITSVVVECVVVSSHCSRIVVERQLWYKLKSGVLGDIGVYFGVRLAQWPGVSSVITRFPFIIHANFRSALAAMIGASAKYSLAWMQSSIRFFLAENNGQRPDFKSTVACCIPPECQQKTLVLCPWIRGVASIGRKWNNCSTGLS